MVEALRSELSHARERGTELRAAAAAAGERVAAAAAEGEVRRVEVQAQRDAVEAKLAALTEKETTAERRAESAAEALKAVQLAREDERHRFNELSTELRQRVADAEREAADAQLRASLHDESATRVRDAMNSLEGKYRAELDAKVALGEELRKRLAQTEQELFVARQQTDSAHREAATVAADERQASGVVVELRQQVTACREGQATAEVAAEEARRCQRAAEARSAAREEELQRAQGQLDAAREEIVRLMQRSVELQAGATAAEGLREQLAAVDEARVQERQSSRQALAEADASRAALAAAQQVAAAAASETQAERDRLRRQQAAAEEAQQSAEAATRVAMESERSYQRRAEEAAAEMRSCRSTEKALRADLEASVEERRRQVRTLERQNEALRQDLSRQRESRRVQGDTELGAALRKCRELSDTLRASDEQAALTAANRSELVRGVWGMVTELGVASRLFLHPEVTQLLARGPRQWSGGIEALRKAEERVSQAHEHTRRLASSLFSDDEKRHLGASALVSTPKSRCRRQRTSTPRRIGYRPPARTAEVTRELIMEDTITPPCITTRSLSPVSPPVSPGGAQVAVHCPSEADHTVSPRRRAPSPAPTPRQQHQQHSECIADDFASLPAYALDMGAADRSSSPAVQ
eukprot:Hpha_TRINITY_DN15570_c1_g1::TRINITY_DN15570_c1_g1_i2::g.107258::m.107258